MTKAEKAKEQKAAADNLRKWLVDGDCLWVTTEYASSGMTRYVRVFLPIKRGDMDHLTASISAACGYPLKDRNGSWYIVMHGCGYSAADDIRERLEAYVGLSVSYRTF